MGLSLRGIDHPLINFFRECYYEVFRFPYGVKNYSGPPVLTYDDYWSAGINNQAQFYPTHRIAFEWIEPGSSVLDVGCGWSMLPLRLQKEKNCRVVAVDISSLVCEHLRREGIDAREADASNFHPGDGEHFDYVLLLDVLEHLPMPEKVLLTLRPHFRKAIISLPNSAFFHYRLCLLRGHFFSQWLSHPSEHLRFWGQVDFLNWLRWIGFKVEKFKSANGPPVVRDLFPNLFGHQICYQVSYGQDDGF